MATTRRMRIDPETKQPLTRRLDITPAWGCTVNSRPFHIPFLLTGARVAVELAKGPQISVLVGLSREVVIGLGKVELDIVLPDDLTDDQVEAERLELVAKLNELVRIDITISAQRGAAAPDPAAP